MTLLSANPEQHRRLIMAARIVGIALWIASIMILITTFLGFLVDECEGGTPRLPAVFVCFPPP